ncbi:hypothetical protein MASR2M15_12390 [Anaerolineales bacterium]
MSFDERQSQQAFFHSILMMVLSQAFDAAGYYLISNEIQLNGGLFRFRKSFSEHSYAFIDFQLLAYTDTMYASRLPSRFRVTLFCSSSALAKPDAMLRQRSLSQLVVEDFATPILPSANYWWQFSNTDELGKALAEAGHLIVGYAMPWLSGDLIPPDNSASGG